MQIIIGQEVKLQGQLILWNVHWTWYMYVHWSVKLHDQTLRKQEIFFMFVFYNRLWETSVMIWP